MTTEEPVRLYGTHIAADPSELYEEIRARHGRVAPILLDDDIPAWFVIGYREVHHVTSNPQLFARDSRRWNQWANVPETWPLLPYVGWTPSIMFAEGGEHQRRAGAIGDALDVIDRTELSSICERASDLLVDTFAGDGEADLVAQYGMIMPLYVLAKVFGLPDADVPTLVRDIAESLDVGEGAADAYARVQARMQRLVKEKRDAPGPDVPSRLLAHPTGLTEEEIVIDLLVVLAAAQAPTGNWIGNALRLMLIDDDFSVSLQGGRTSVAQALNEVLWKDTPTQNFIGRWAAHDCELGGRRIRRGDLLVLGFAAANRDPQVRPSFHDTGTNRAHMSFGHGEHGCTYPGPEMGEIMAKTAIEVLLDRLPDVRLAVDAKDLKWRPSLWMRGLFALPVSFTPTTRVSRG